MRDYFFLLNFFFLFFAATQFDQRHRRTRVLRAAFLRERLLFRQRRSARGRGGTADAARSHNGNVKCNAKKRERL